MSWGERSGETVHTEGAGFRGRQGLTVMITKGLLSIHSQGPKGRAALALGLDRGGSRLRLLPPKGVQSPRD